MSCTANTALCHQEAESWLGHSDTATDASEQHAPELGAELCGPEWRQRAYAHLQLGLKHRPTTRHPKLGRAGEDAEDVACDAGER